MEKNQEIIKASYQELVRQIVATVRNKARTVPAFAESYNGCIRITVTPLSRAADEWLGNLSGYSTWLNGEENDVCTREFVYKIDPRGSYVIQYACEDGHTEPVNCYGYSALKTAYENWDNKFMDWVNREPLLEGTAADEFIKRTKYFKEENGWAMHAGSVIMKVGVDGEDFLELFVCVSGATAEEDTMCAEVGMATAHTFFKEYAVGDLACTPDYVMM